MIITLAAMEDAFPIISVEPDWVLEPEQMGTKDKFWFRDPNDPEERDWLFKFPTPGTGQHWSEKLAPPLGRELHDKAGGKQWTCRRFRGSARQVGLVSRHHRAKASVDCCQSG